MLLFGVLMIEVFLSGGAVFEVVFCLMLVARCMLMRTLMWSCMFVLVMVGCSAVVVVGVGMCYCIGGG